jgi:tetratricopeptide (TPR) repeat protein
MYTKAIEAYPQYRKAFAKRGALEAKLGRLDAAIKDLSQAIAIDSKDEVAYVERARTYVKLKNNKLAVDDYNQYLKLHGKKDAQTEQVAAWIKKLGGTPEK